MFQLTLVRNSGSGGSCYFEDKRKIEQLHTAAHGGHILKVEYHEIVDDHNHTTRFRVNLPSKSFSKIVRRSICDFFRDLFERAPDLAENSTYYKSRTDTQFADNCIKELNLALERGEHRPITTKKLTCCSQDTVQAHAFPNDQSSTETQCVVMIEMASTREEALESETIGQLEGATLIVVDFDSIIFHNPQFNDQVQSTNFRVDNSHLLQALESMRKSKPNNKCVIVGLSNNKKGFWKKVYIITILKSMVSMMLIILNLKNNHQILVWQ